MTTLLADDFASATGNGSSALVRCCRHERCRAVSAGICAPPKTDVRLLSVVVRVREAAEWLRFRCMISGWNLNYRPCSVLAGHRACRVMSPTHCCLTRHTVLMLPACGPASDFVPRWKLETNDPVLTLYVSGWPRCPVIDLAIDILVDLVLDLVPAKGYCRNRDREVRHVLHISALVLGWL